MLGGHVVGGWGQKLHFGKCSVEQSGQSGVRMNTIAEYVAKGFGPDAGNR